MSTASGSSLLRIMTFRQPDGRGRQRGRGRGGGRGRPTLLPFNVETSCDVNANGNGSQTNMADEADARPEAGTEAGVVGRPEEEARAKAGGEARAKAGREARAEAGREAGAEAGSSQTVREADRQTATDRTHRNNNKTFNAFLASPWGPSEGTVVRKL